MIKKTLDQTSIDSLNNHLTDASLNPVQFSLGNMFACTLDQPFSLTGEITKNLIVTGFGRESLVVRVLNDNYEIDEKLKENILGIGEIKTFYVLGESVSKQERTLVEDALFNYALHSGDLRKSVEDITEQLIAKHNEAYKLIVKDLEK